MIPNHVSNSYSTVPGSENVVDTIIFRRYKLKIWSGFGWLWVKWHLHTAVIPNNSEHVATPQNSRTPAQMIETVSHNSKRIVSTP